MPLFSHFFRFSSTEIKNVFSKAISRKEVNGLKVIIAPALHEFGRLLIITPRTIGNAPERNLIRRRLKALFFEEQFFNCPVDVIIQVRKDGINLSFEQLKQIMHDVFKKYNKNNID